MEGFNTPAGGTGQQHDPLERAGQDIRERCGDTVDITWDDAERVAITEVRKLKVVAGDLPLVFPIEHSVLVERGAPYRAFLDKVVSDVRNVLRGDRAAPPAS